MQKIIVAFLLCIVVLSACKNEKKPEIATDKKSNVVLESQTDVKAHSCSAACKDGFHVYIHNETGHTCSTDCGKKHVCSDFCKGDAHVYAHGEVGHYCTCPTI